MDIFIDRILAIYPKPLTLLVELSNGDFGVTLIPVTVDARWNLDDRSGNLVRYATMRYAKHAFERAAKRVSAS